MPHMLGLGTLRTLLRRKRAAAEGRKGALLMRLAEVMGQTVGPHFRLGSFQEALERSVWAYRSAYSVAGAVSTTRFLLVETETQETVTGPKADRVRMVLQDVNPEQTFIEFLFAWTVHLLVDGEAYIEKARNRFGETRELFIWNPEDVEPIPDKSGRRRISGYRFNIGGRALDFPADDVIPTRNYNMRNPFRGFSPIAPVRTEIAADMEAATHNLSLLRRGARHGGILSPKEGEMLSEEELGRMISQIEARSMGGANAGRPMVLPASFTFTNDTLSPRDADFLQSRKFSREVIAASIGATPIMVNNLDNGTYTNTEQQQRAFWDTTGKLLLGLFYGSLNEHWVHKEIDPKLSLAPDLVGIDATIDSEKTRTENTRTLKLSGIITANEARARHGFEPVPDGDKLDVPLNIAPRPVDDITNPQAEQPDEVGGESAPEAGQQVVTEDGSVQPSAAAGVGSFSQNGVNGRTKTHDREAMRQAQELAVNSATEKLAERARDALKNQRNKILERVRLHGGGSCIENCVGSVDEQARELMKSLVTGVLTTIRDSGALHLRRMGGKMVDRWTMKIPQDAGIDDPPDRLIRLITAFDLDNPQVAEYLKQFFGRHIMAISSETLLQLEKMFRDALQAGEGVSELVERIRGLGAFSDARARRIARTETTAAFNLGAQEAFAAAGTPGKSWLSARAESTRDSHLDVDKTSSAQPIETGLSFTLRGKRGESQLRFPGDPGGPAHEVVNCVCTLVPEDLATRAVYAAHCRKELAE